MTPLPKPSASLLLNAARRPLPGVACMNRSYPAGYGQRYTEAAHVDLELVESPVESLQALPLVLVLWSEMSFCTTSRPRDLETSLETARG